MNDPGYHRTRGRDPFARGSFGRQRRSGDQEEPPVHGLQDQEPSARGDQEPSGPGSRHAAALAHDPAGPGTYLAAPHLAAPHLDSPYDGDGYDRAPDETDPVAGGRYPGVPAGGDPYERELRSRQLYRDQPSRRGSYQPEPPGHEPGGRRPGQPRRWLRRYAVIGTGAGVAALAGGAIMVLPHRLAAPVADHCFVSCATPGTWVSAGPEPVASPGVSAGTRAVRIPKPSHSPSHKPRAKAKPASVTASPRPPTSAAPSTPVRPDFAVSYRESQHLLGGFTGTFTITNQGSTTLSGWTLAAVFPGDGFSSASGANASSSGDTITWAGPPDISPGASLQVSFNGYGSSSSPASCTFDGFSC